jgi:methylated-DNA-protein-cysteine methyltransferase-like protein
MNSRQRTYYVTSQIPKGKVLTYKTLARLAKVSNPRLIGLYLHRNEDPTVPCYRVVNSAGKVAKTYAFGGGDIQKQKLEKDGIVFTKNKINLNTFLWQPDIPSITAFENSFKK